MGEHINKDDTSLKLPSVGRGGGVLTVAVIHRLPVGEEG